MAHDHQNHAGSNDTGVGIAFFLNLGFTLVEIAGGFWTGSIAILSDALHDLGDTLSLGIAWYFQQLSRKGRTPGFTYGYKRFNTLGAIITGLVLVSGSVLILTRAVPALWAPSEPHAEGMIYLAILGVIVNAAAAFRVRKGGDSLNERVISWHLLEDVLGWVAVLVGSILMYFYDLPWIDPALSIGITLFILYGVVKQLGKAGKIIVEATPEGLDPDAITQALREIKNVQDAHHLHLWTLDGQYHLASVHLVVRDTDNLQFLVELKEQARGVFHDAGVEHATLELETRSEWKTHESDTSDV